MLQKKREYGDDGWILERQCIILKGQSICFLINCIPCLKDGVIFSFAASKKTPSSVCPAVTCRVPRALIGDIASKASPLATVSHQISFRPWAAASANHQAGHALWQLSCFLNNHKQQLKTSPDSSLCPCCYGLIPEPDFSHATEEVKSSDSLSPLKPLSIAIFSCGCVELPDTHCSSKGIFSTILSWSKFTYSLK